MLEPARKRYDIQVTAANQSYTLNIELDKSIKSLKGFLFTSDKDDLLYYRGSQRIEINNKEHFPDNYETKLFMSGIVVPPGQRYYPLENMNPGSGLIKIKYQDSDDGRTVFVPYRVSFYLDSEREGDL